MASDPHDEADVDVQQARAKALEAAQLAAGGENAEGLPDGNIDEDDAKAMANDPVEVGRRKAAENYRKRVGGRQPVSSGPPPPIDPNEDVIEEVVIDLKVEVPKLMKKAGIRQNQYNEKIELTNWEYYTEIIKAHYAGRDTGYKEGYQLASRSIYRRLRIYTLTSFITAIVVIIFSIFYIIRHLHWG
jgi:hypothetical protein